MKVWGKEGARAASGRGPGKVDNRDFPGCGPHDTPCLGFWVKSEGELRFGDVGGPARSFGVNIWGKTAVPPIDE